MPTHIRNQKIALITCKDLPSGTADDLLTEGPLKKLGYNLVPVIWDETSILELNRFAAVVFRSPWDYQHKKEAFTIFVNSLQNLPIPIFNSPKILIWNIDKSYLFELESLGVKIIPSKKILKNQDHHFWQNMLQNLTWDKVVIKPTISASAFNTYLVSKEEAHKRSHQWEGLSLNADFIVQEFCPSIQTEGEVSLIFFNDGAKIIYSHSVLKRPAANEFRVQPHMGGTIESFKADQSAIDFSNLVLSKINSEWLYARVDILKHQGQWALGELEILEPQLYFSFDQESPERFSRAISARIYQRITT